MNNEWFRRTVNCALCAYDPVSCNIAYCLPKSRKSGRFQLFTVSIKTNLRMFCISICPKYWFISYFVWFHSIWLFYHIPSISLLLAINDFKKQNSRPSFIPNEINASIDSTMFWFLEKPIQEINIYSKWLKLKQLDSRARFKKSFGNDGI